MAFLTGLFVIAAANVTSATLAVVLFMGGCLVGLSTANQLVLLQSCTPPEKVGLAVGIYNFVGNIAGILAPLVTGFIIQYTGLVHSGLRARRSDACRQSAFLLVHRRSVGRPAFGRPTPGCFRASGWAGQLMSFSRDVKLGSSKLEPMSSHGFPKNTALRVHERSSTPPQSFGVFVWAFVGIWAASSLRAELPLARLHTIFPPGGKAGTISK